MEPAAVTAVAAGIQAAATVVLVLVTVRYVRLVGEQAEAAEESARATKRSAEASERMARLQTREARQAMIPQLNELADQLAWIFTRLEDWREKSPQWEEMRSGNPPHSLGYDGGDVRDARELAAGVFVEEDYRLQVSKVLTRLSRFETMVRVARRGDTISEAAVTDLEDEFRSLYGDVEMAINLINGLVKGFYQ